jgi:hypothetical protein
VIAREMPKIVLTGIQKTEEMDFSSLAFGKIIEERRFQQPFFWPQVFQEFEKD